MFASTISVLSAAAVVIQLLQLWYTNMFDLVEF